MILRLTHYFIPLRLSISLLSQYSFNDIIYLIIFPYITKKKKNSAFFRISAYIVILYTKKYQFIECIFK